MKHVGRDPREKLQKLSCHRLPGVDIRPGEKKNSQRKSGQPILENHDIGLFWTICGILFVNFFMTPPKDKKNF